jgi:hypothetical protein
VALREAQFMAPVAREYLNGKNRDSERPFADYQRFCEKGIDILEDVLDSFWEYLLAFAQLVHSLFPEYMTEMFAGRIYERQPSPALHEFRKLLKRAEERERSYEHEDLYSIRIGSRFHPERAPIWETTSPIETTEKWMGPR